MTKPTEEVRRTVRNHYGEIARGERANCGTSASSCCSPSNGYSADELDNLPQGADLGLGCGNPGAIAALRPGETVIDLGSGGGIDCFLAAERVGPQGQVIGIDMTADMVDRARSAKEKADAQNVDFRLGEIENLPVGNETADVIVSNCVINLSTNKQRVWEEAYRVLKPGGRIAVSDIVATAELPQDVRQDLALHAACIAGASTVDEVTSLLSGAGFENIAVTPRTMQTGDDRLDGRLASAAIEASRPL